MSDSVFRLTADSGETTIQPMEYRVTLKSNPRLLILFAMIAVLPAISIALILLWSPIAGAIVLAIVAYVDYHLVKFVRLQLASYVRTDDDGIRGLSGISEKVDIPWETVTHAGVAMESQTRGVAFVYAEEQDQLISVPSDYENFDQFVSELESRFDVLRLDLEPGESITDKLKEILEEEEPAE